MAGMSIDPEKCRAAKRHLFLTTANYFTTGRSVRDLVIGKPLNVFQKITLPTWPPLAVLASRVLPDKPFWYPKVVQQVWNDCDIGGGLQRSLSHFKTKASLVADKLFPVTSYAEAIADHAASATTITKGMAIVGAATVVGAISAALYMLGLREVPMMDAAPAGFGFTTGDSPLSSDQNNFL